MVLKQGCIFRQSASRFESDVISDGTQTMVSDAKIIVRFESDVISDGTQTHRRLHSAAAQFESDVISDGTQTISSKLRHKM